MLKVGKINDPVQKLNPWFAILLTAPFFILVTGFVLYRWTIARKDYSLMVSHMIQRQNAVLAHDAMTAAKEMARLLENAGKDLHLLALFSPTSSNLLKFYLSRLSQVTQINFKDDSVESVPLPIYNEIIYFNLHGDETIRFSNGKQVKNLKPFAHCTEVNFCDKGLIGQALHSSVGEVFFGKLMRWYAPKDTIEVEEGAFLPVIYRTSERVILLGIDYRYLKDLLSYPTFPYERKRNLLQSYQNGNYIYVVDGSTDILVHPKYWHVTGIDRNTGKRAIPITDDAEDGMRPLNVIAYKGLKLREYFERLRNRSFLQKSVDVFEAPNLRGTNRVLSVAPILVSRGQFRETGVFGYLILGCSVDYFEEPKEKYVPYY